MLRHAFLPHERLLKRANSVFSHDVTEAILVCQNNETEAMLVFQTSPLVDCKTVGFFLKISKELGIAREPHTPVFLASLPSLALCFQPRFRPFV